MAATPERRAFVAQELRWVVVEDSGVAAAHPMARQHEVESLLHNAADAQALAAAMAALFGADRRLYRFTAYQVQHRLQRGDTITVRHPEFFPAGRAMLVWDIRESVGGGDRATEITVWG